MGKIDNETRTHEEVTEHVRKIITRMFPTEEPDAEGIEMVGRLMSVFLTLMGDMVRITCIVHEQVERHNDICAELIQTELYAFLLKNVERTIPEYAKVMREFVLFVRDATERKLGVTR